MTDWKPGDIANGHILGDDLVWRPVDSADADAPGRFDPREGLLVEALRQPVGIPPLASCAVCGRDISTKASACPSCGHPTLAFACPRCNQTDQVRKVGTVIDSGSTTTTGTARTVGAGTFGLGVGATSFNAQTSSELAKGFRIPREPMSPAMEALAVFGIAFIALAVLLGSLAEEDATMWAGLALATAAAILAFNVVGRSYERRRRLWEEARVRLREAYFCFRDNIVFSDNDKNPREPAAFAERTFAEFVEAQEGRLPEAFRKR